MARPDFDICIAGGGPAGLSLAIGAKIALGEECRIAVFDPNFGSVRPRLRTSALSEGSRRLLDSLGVWTSIEQHAHPIRKMNISDSRLRDIVRNTFLEFESGSDGAPLAHVAYHADIEDALELKARLAGVRLIQSFTSNLRATENQIVVTTGDGANHTSTLLIGCDGARSQVRQQAHIQAVGWNYDSIAIVATVTAERDHDDTAVQHFLPAGSFALLPIAPRQFSVVWVEHPREGEYLRNAPQEIFDAELQKRAGNRFGQLRLAGPRGAFPLRLQIARRFVTHRVALVGDAAHSMHPLAGQGLNYGLKDVSSLLQCLKEQGRLGLDIGSESCLAEYQMQRRPDTAKMLALTESLFRIFSIETPPIRQLRDMGMGIINRLPHLKTSMIAEISGEPIRKLQDKTPN